MTPKEIADKYIGLMPTNNEWGELRQELADKIEAYAQEQVNSVDVRLSFLYEVLEVHGKTSTRDLTKWLLSEIKKHEV